jgi:DNA-binding GntR family transcriptional regulator
MADNEAGLHLLQPLEMRESVERRVARTLRDLIVTDRLPDGTPLVQRELAGRLGVSQTPVRTALLHLEREGFVSTGATGRTSVRPLTREDLEEVYAARLGLEGLAARVGAQAVGEPELARMRPMLERLRALAEADAVDEYLRMRWEFHVACYAAAGRERLVAEVERLYWRAERYNRRLLAGTDRYARSVEHYHLFLVACERRSGREAEDVVQDSVRWAVELLAPTLPSESRT